ncbi:hypothetical protein AALO_G00204320, partial [Alosa alosa]
AILTLVSVFCLCVTAVAGQHYKPFIQLISSYSAVLPGETVLVSCGRMYNCQNRVAHLYRNGVFIKRQSCHYRSSVTFTIEDVSNTGLVVMSSCYLSI